MVLAFAGIRRLVVHIKAIETDDLLSLCRLVGRWGGSAKGKCLYYESALAWLCGEGGVVSGLCPPGMREEAIGFWGLAERPWLGFSSYVLPNSLELSDTKVYEPEIRALLGTAADFSFVVVSKLLGLSP